jgi:hypothetical protein
LTAEKKAKETGDSPAKRLEITAAMSFNFALVRLAPCCSAGAARTSTPSSSFPLAALSSNFQKSSVIRFVKLKMMNLF